jgi:hypothetical protein
LIEWRRLLTVVQPETLLRWHRQAFRLFWRWKSRRRGRPRLPAHLQELIGEMTHANRTWGEERIAVELLLKLGISVSPRTTSRAWFRRNVLQIWVRTPRPDASLGPGIPGGPSLASGSTGHQLPHGQRVAAVAILGGLHHEYRLESDAA